MNRNFLKLGALAAIALSPMFSNAQLVNELPNLRPYDKTGINVFEAPKETGEEFDGVKIKLGAGFTQNFPGIKTRKRRGGTNLYPRLAPGFGVAQANLNIDALLAHGVLLNVTTYLSSRHHSEAWVKGGYIQLDKLPFIKNEAVDR